MGFDLTITKTVKISKALLLQFLAVHAILACVTPVAWGAADDV